jgi:hypothetical protein
VEYCLVTSNIPGVSLILERVVGWAFADVRYLSDSNAEWGQQLWAAKKYLNGRQVQSCWLSYSADVVVEPS